MTDAERITALEARVSELMELLRLALTPKQRSAGADRQARYEARKRQKASDVTSDVTSEGETIEGVNVHLPGDVTPKDVTPPHISPPQPDVRSDVRSDAKPHPYSADFEAFWTAYPQRNGVRVEKREASEKFKRWVLLNETEAVVIAARNYAAYCQTSQRLPMDAHRWLRDGDWREWSTPIGSNGNGHHEPEVRYGPQGEKYIDGVLVMEATG